MISEELFVEMKTRSKALYACREDMDIIESLSLSEFLSHFKVCEGLYWYSKKY